MWNFAVRWFSLLNLYCLFLCLDISWEYQAMTRDLATKRSECVETDKDGLCTKCSTFIIENSHQCVSECPENTDTSYREGAEVIGWVCVYHDKDETSAKRSSRNGVVIIVLTVIVSLASIAVVVFLVFRRRITSSRLSRILGNRKLFFSRDRGDKKFDDDRGIEQVGEELSHQKILNLRRKKPVILEILDKAKKIEQDQTSPNRIEREVSLGLILILQLLEEYETKMKITSKSLTPGMIARLMSWGEQVIASYENSSLSSKDQDGGSVQSIKDKPLRFTAVPHYYSKESALSFVMKRNDQLNFPATDL
ncbi:uncharacterized protein LOC106478246 [Limulus polyphemus]|uniref:Uncharacterized protein LOC106478246 n=1 Tax=Limulus polyphemus TaxID=6850 RepID=A0ABM1C4X0_LIMPO|nr:uncharacterized protein LOC106478246 [Limulus polyphemus]